MPYTLTTPRLQELAGVSNRQLDHAYRCGHLLPRNALAGSGSRLQWPPVEVAIVERLAQVSAVLPIGFSELCELYAPQLREGLSVNLMGTWGRFTIRAIEVATERLPVTGGQAVG